MKEFDTLSGQSAGSLKQLLSNAQSDWPRPIDTPIRPGSAIDPVSASTILKFLDAIYAGPLEQRFWGRFAGLIEQEFDCHAIVVLEWPERYNNGRIISADEELSRKLLRDPIVRRNFQDLPAQRVCSLNEMAREPNLPMLGVDFRQADTATRIRLRLARIGPPAVEFDAQVTGVLRYLAPHLERAAGLYARIGMLQYMIDDYAETASGMSTAVVALDPEFRILNCMGATDELFAKGTFGIAADRTLFCTDSRANASLRKAFVEVLSQQVRNQGLTHILLPINESGRRRTWHISLKKMPVAHVAQQEITPGVKLFIRSTGAVSFLTETSLSDLYGLTRAQARLALELVQGFSLYEAAEHLGIRRNTARSHLSAIFSKLNVNRQSALVQKLLSHGGAGWL